MALGHRFRTRSDTEVIVHAYEEWGDDAFDRFNGQWAIALWDSRATRRWSWRAIRSACGRSTVSSTRGRLFFASEVKAIFAADRELPRALRSASASTQTFTFWTPVPPQTVFARRDRARARRASASTAAAACTDARAYDPAFPDGRRRRLPRLARRRRRRGARGARARPRACACCAPTCRSAATCRAASTARSSPRSACAPRAIGSRPSRCASRTPSTTRPRSSA